MLMIVEMATEDWEVGDGAIYHFFLSAYRVTCLPLHEI